jgi:hypothetical protein
MNADVNARICAYVSLASGHSGEKDGPQQNGEFHYLDLWRIFSCRIPLFRLLANFFSRLLAHFFSRLLANFFSRLFEIFFSRLLETFWCINFAAKFPKTNMTFLNWGI